MFPLIPFYSLLFISVISINTYNKDLSSDRFSSQSILWCSLSSQTFTCHIIVFLFAQIFSITWFLTTCHHLPVLVLPLCIEGKIRSHINKYVSSNPLTWNTFETRQTTTLFSLTISNCSANPQEHGFLSTLHH